MYLFIYIYVPKTTLRAALAVQWFETGKDQYVCVYIYLFIYIYVPKTTLRAAPAALWFESGKDRRVCVYIYQLIYNIYVPKTTLRATLAALWFETGNDRRYDSVPASRVSPEAVRTTPVAVKSSISSMPMQGPVRWVGMNLRHEGIQNHTNKDRRPMVYMPS